MMHKPMGPHFRFDVRLDRVIRYSSLSVTVDRDLETEGGQGRVDCLLFCLNFARTQMLAGRCRQSFQ